MTDKFITPDFKLVHVPADHMPDYRLYDRRTGMTIQFDSIRIAKNGPYLNGSYAKFKQMGELVGYMREKLYNDLPDMFIEALEVLDETGSLPSRDEVSDKGREVGTDAVLKINGEEFDIESMSMSVSEGEPVDSSFDYVPGT